MVAYAAASELWPRLCLAAVETRRAAGNAENLIVGVVCFVRSPHSLPSLPLLRLFPLETFVFHLREKRPLAHKKSKLFAFIFLHTSRQQIQQ